MVFSFKNKITKSYKAIESPKPKRL
jgi:hypothetical protein